MKWIYNKNYAISKTNFCFLKNIKIGHSSYDILADSNSQPTTSSSGSQSPLDQITKTRLDLTIQGHGIKQPKWWIESVLSHNHNTTNTTSASTSSSSSTNNIGFQFIDLDHNSVISSSDGVSNKREDDECDSAAMFINANSTLDCAFGRIGDEEAINEKEQSKTTTQIQSKDAV